MKKLVLPISLILLIGFMAFVFASSSEASVNINSGWNLVYGFTHPDRITSNSEISSNNIKAVYLLDQRTKEYVRVYPNPESSKLEGIEDSYYEQTAQWVYSDKSGKMNYIAEEPLPISEHKLYVGWNLVALTTDDLVGKKINEFKGTCNIEKVYAFEPTKQDWINMIDEEMQYEALGLGMAIKVTNECNLGIKIDDGGLIAPPPSIPN